MSPPTPGPWMIQGRYAVNRVEIGNGSRAIATVWAYDTHDPTGRPLDKPAENPEGMANVRLIVEAPNLLAALVDLVNAIDRLGTINTPRVKAARAVIARATWSDPAVTPPGDDS